MFTDKNIETADLESRTIGALIRRRRGCHGLSQYQLAAQLARLSGNNAIDRNRVARWERGGRVPDPYWRGWLSLALLVPKGRLDQAARVTYAQRDYEKVAY
ncbi:MAG: helix-turn-helix domain-containing protein [Stackebrandtia sp.]